MGGAGTNHSGVGVESRLHSEQVDSHRVTYRDEEPITLMHIGNFDQGWAINIPTGNIGKLEWF